MRYLVRPLARTPVSPNQLTTLRLLTGIAAAVALGVGTAEWRNVGAGIFLVSLALDRADGELARLSGKTSPGGHRYDLMADSLCNALTFVGLGVGYVGAIGPWGLLMGLVAGAGIVVVLRMTIKIEAMAGARAAELQGVGGFDPDDAMLVVPAAVWLDEGLSLLYASAVGAPLFALFFAWTFREALRADH